VKVTLGKELTR